MPKTPYTYGPLQQSCNRPHIKQLPYSLDAILASPNDGIKGDIFIRCPITGQPVPTGLHTVVFDTLPKIEMRIALARLSQKALVELYQSLGHRN